MTMTHRKIHDIAMGVFLAALLLLVVSGNVFAVDIKISALPSASAPSGTETIPCVQGGVTSKCTVAQILGGNAATSTALAASPANCSSGQAPRGINASGTAQNCTEYDAAGTAAGKIAASISDGDTTHSPDGNSIYDALALKAPKADPIFTGTLTSPISVLPIIKPASDSTTAVGIFKANGTTNVVNVDTTNSFVGINTIPTAQLSQQSTALLESAPLGTEITDTNNWTATAGWTGNYATGFAHTAGVTTLSRTMTISTATLYQISFTVTGRTAGSFTVGLGGEISNKTFAATGAYGPKTLNGTGDLIFTPTTDFNGTISAISVKAISGIYGATYNILDSAGVSNIEIRSSLAGLYNQFIGRNVGKYNTTGSSNTANGFSTLSYNTTGYSNVAYGFNSLAANTTGYYNTASGAFSLGVNTTGTFNTATGYSSLQSNTTGYNNVANGAGSLSTNTTGYNNVANGYYSLYANTTGIANTANGPNAMFFNTTGQGNTASGISSLNTNTTGNYNTASGYYSLYASGKTVTAGSFITGAAYTIISAGDTNFAALGAADNNVGTIFTTNGVGSGTGTAAANSNNNIAYGFNAGRFLTNGSTLLSAPSYSLFLGATTKASADGLTNENVIGYGAVGNGSNSVTLGNDSITKTILKGSVGVNTTDVSAGKLICKGAGTTTGVCIQTQDSTGAALFTTLDNGKFGNGAAPAHYIDITKASENQRTVYGANVLMSAALLQQDAASTGNDETLDSQFHAWPFTASASHTVGSWAVRLKTVGTVTNTIDYIRLKIYSDNAGVPNTLLATTDSVKMGNLTSSYVLYVFGIDLTLVSGTTYWIAVERGAVVTGGGSIAVDRNGTALTSATASAPISADWTVLAGLGRYVLYGQSPAAIVGYSSNKNGVTGGSSSGYGVSASSITSYGLLASSTNSFGVRADSINSVGVYGTSTNSVGVQGTSTNSYGVYGTSINMVGVSGISTTSYGVSGTSTGGTGVFGSSTNLFGGVFYQNGTLTASNGSNTLLVRRFGVTNSTGSLNYSGNILQLTDNPTGTGTVTGSLISGQIDATTRLDFNPRVADGASAVAYMVDSANTLSTAGSKLLSIRNAGAEKVSVEFNGAITASQYKLSALNTAPATSSETCTIGEIRITATYVFLCSATNTWVRSAFAAW